MPVFRPLFSPTVPDLARIAPGAWYDALLPLAPVDRMSAVQNSSLGVRVRGEAVDLVLTLPAPPSDAAREAVRTGMAVPIPGATTRRSPRQVNIRLTDKDHESLATAASLLGTKPGVLARMLVLNGVRRVLAEHDAAIDRARRGQPCAGPGAPRAPGPGAPASGS